jgi:hypothetical protein
LKFGSASEKKRAEPTGLEPALIEFGADLKNAL